MQGKIEKERGMGGTTESLLCDIKCVLHMSGQALQRVE